MKASLLSASLWVLGTLYAQNERLIAVKVSWTAEACQAPFNRQAANDLGTPQSASGMTLHLHAATQKEEWKLVADEKSCILIPATEGLWHLFAPEKRRHYGSVAEKDSACVLWKRQPNASFTLHPPFPDTLFINFHRTCPPCKIPVPASK